MMDYNLNGIDYKIKKLNARSQFHIVRRLAPVLGGLAPSPSDSDSDNKDMAQFASLAKAISGLSDEDSDYCLFGLLNAVSRKEDKGLGYSPIVNGYNFMYQDIDFKSMLLLAWEVLSFNLSDFFADLPSDLKEVVQSASGV